MAKLGERMAVFDTLPLITFNHQRHYINLHIYNIELYNIELY